MPKKIDRTGETSIANNGQTMTIVKYINNKNIIVEFDDEQKTRVETKYYCFKKGTVKNPNYTPHIGETAKATNGYTMTIVEYINVKHITVEFDDKHKTRVKTSYDLFKKGHVLNPNAREKSYHSLENKRIGEKSVASNGQTMTIVEYSDARHIIVEFDDAARTHVETQYDSFKKGMVRNPNYVPRKGETNTAINGQTMTIVEYINANHIIVEFNDELKTRVKTTYRGFKTGAVKNPNYRPTGIRAKHYSKQRTGEISVASNGQIMTIVEYINANHIIVEFNDEFKTRVKTKYSCFKNGSVRNPNYHIGETSKATNGQTMTIVEHINNKNIIVEFDDGTRVKTSYSSFKKGAIKNPNYHISETNTATNGQTMTIVEYINCRNIIVEFDDGTRVKTIYNCFIKGNVKNPCFPMCGKGAYKTFQTQYAYTAPNGKVYFYCECQKCGFKANLTAIEAIGLTHGCWKRKEGDAVCRKE